MILLGVILSMASALASDFPIPHNATEFGEMLREGTMTIAIIVLFAKWVWSDWLKRGDKLDKIKEAVMDEIKAKLVHLQKTDEEMDAAFQILLSTVTKLQVTYEQHAANVAERRKQIDGQIKELQDIINRLMVTKAKEIAEFDTKINDHARRIDKIETKCDRNHSRGVP